MSSHSSVSSKDDKQQQNAQNGAKIENKLGDEKAYKKSGTIWDSLRHGYRKRSIVPFRDSHWDNDSDDGKTAKIAVIEFVYVSRHQSIRYQPRDTPFLGKGRLRDEPSSSAQVDVRRRKRS